VHVQYVHQPGEKMKIVCYDISSLIRKKLALKKCPCCQGRLTSRVMECSQASRAFEQSASDPVISTYLFQCPDCSWWAVRELRSDDALYDPPVEEFIVMQAFKKNMGKRERDAEPWKQVLADQKHWKKPAPIQSADAIELFGSTQMLLPDINSISGQDVFDRIKSVAPILFPILVVIGIAVFYRM
jgi:hypothetical protein